MNHKKIVILHQDVPKEAPPDDKDVLIAAENIFQILEQENFDPLILPVDDDFQFISVLKTINPFLVVNLVESFMGSSFAAAMIPKILQSLHLPHTGNSSQCLLLTTDKMLTKHLLLKANLPTPHADKYPTPETFVPGWYIFKPLREDASLGISDENIHYVNSAKEALDMLHTFETKFSIPFFLERFIEGREFNVSVISEKGSPRVFQPAEILFTGDVNPYRIMDYESKWIKSSQRYKQSYRTFNFPKTDQPLIEQLIHLTEACWELTGLEGYARVDFRVDQKNNPWILEVNANPCSSPDSGFIAAAQNEGLSYNELMLHLIYEAFHDDQKRDPSL
ncbi:MAG: ATP-grasp domain-containing protein [Candidatus Marinimicrobia bacterium]|nr:ATP-grasp domain-containing protein [Candidatus Neomarinimicrobiota bacterium]MDD5583413.1 ATP-grasp domain-containing protein [Candidatus Neomarinimicrobiota bacterium]